MVTLHVESLSGRIGDFELGPIDLKVTKGKISGIIGPSGCGKTLLLRMIAGLHEPISGRIMIDGIDMSEAPPSQRGVAFIFQDDALFPHYSAYNNVAFPLRIEKDKEVNEKVMQKAHELDGLYEYLDLKPSQLPAGIRKLTAIGRETLRKFSVILMDEPFERLDRKIRTQLRVMVKRLLMQLGKAVLLIMNDPEDAMSVTDELHIMTQGSIIRSGKAREVYNEPGSAEALELMSPNGVNRLGDRIFRPEDVEISTTGLKATIVHSSLFDGKRMICSAMIEQNPVVLLLPMEVARMQEVSLKIIKSYKYPLDQ